SVSTALFLRWSCFFQIGTLKPPVQRHICSGHYKCVRCGKYFAVQRIGGIEGKSMTMHQNPLIPEHPAWQHFRAKALGSTSLRRVGGAIALLVAGGVLVHVLGPGQAKPPAEAAVQVDVQTIHPQQIRLWSSFSGRMDAVDSAQIRPEVSGRVV